jgi:hypothetical protein
MKQDIVVLEISVNDVKRVQVLQAIQHLKTNGSHSAFVQGLREKLDVTKGASIA